jgi:hypothetical protein
MRAQGGALEGEGRSRWRAVEVLVGDALRTPTGRTYLIVERRVQKRGEHVGRQHLGCLVAKEPPPGVRVRRMHWYRRARRASSRKVDHERL